MQKKQSMNGKTIMSIEEYVKKRQKDMEEEGKKKGYTEIKSPAWMLAELYG